MKKLFPNKVFHYIYYKTVIISLVVNSNSKNIFQKVDINNYLYKQIVI